MDIPLVIFKDIGSVYGVNVPNIKGVHSWDDAVDDAPKNVKDSITGHIATLLERGEPVEISHGTIEALQKNPDHAGGILALVHLDLDKLDSKPERINISLLKSVYSFLLSPLRRAPAQPPHNAEKAGYSPTIEDYAIFVFFP